MGVNASSYPHSCSPRFGGHSPTQQTFIGTSYAPPSYGVDSKLYSLEHCPDKPQDKKKKSSSLATLKRRFIKRRKASRSADHARHMRDLLSGWDVRDVAALVEEYEGTAALKELSMQACLARPKARTLSQDFASLYQHKYCTDVELVFQDTRFAAHRAVLAARCPFFRTLLSSSPGYSTQLRLDVGMTGMDPAMFSALLRYLYTGELVPDDARLHNMDVLLRLSEEFGMPSSLEMDMHELRQRMCYYDSVLCFSSDSEPDEPFVADMSGDDEELKAHKAVLAARSPFFRNLLQRRVRTAEEETAPARIVLNESIIPRKYAGVVLHCMYTDAVELERVSISLDSVVPILKWSSQPYGSKWVHRQALHFLCEEFSQVMTSDVLYQLNKEYLLGAIQSDYLQASEQDILKYVVKWGEHQLIRRMADREPNLLSGTAHSVNKRGVKRRDLDVEELKEILSVLLPCVRTEHVLPTSSEVLSDTLKRGLISTPPSDMIPTVEGGKGNAWLRQKSAGIYVRPRLFTPYVEEAKLVVEQTELVRLRMVRMSNVPDTLYMVNNAIPQCCHMINHQQMTGSQTAPPSVVANEIPVPRLAVVKEMIRRLHELRHTEQVQRAYALNCGEGAAVSYELQIRVLREFGLPVLALRPSTRCRVNSTPAVESMFTDLQSMMGLHPPLPPPPPPYHPPTTHQIRSGWRPRVPAQQPTRSLSYPCNHSLLHTQASTKIGSPIYPSTGVKAVPPDCTNLQGRLLIPNKKGTLEPGINEFMPDIAIGVSAMSLKDHRLPEVTMEVEALDPRPIVSTLPPISECFPGRHPHSSSRKRHAAEPKPDMPQHTHFPDLYELYTHSRGDTAHRLHHALGAQANQRAPPKGETDLTCGLGPDTEPYEEWNPSRRGAAAVAGMGEEGGGIAGRERRSPNKHEYLYRKSAL
ncbi:BTB/POZ domain-containing protein 7 [Bagarius yarrelli]|uniref:BTB/POZ domain-containing protein 7 n=1 Tax=Bagarius yarrelli TaxID=175774 RepID=A0A556V281_BAGYA|nr:BTB/POZ domain-containing protein 7 [Bagarius yarrelli]